MKTNKSVPATTISTVKANEMNFTVLTAEQLNCVIGGTILPQDILSGIAAAKGR